ncbi:hypothetical protein OHA21_07025 [Actinoplanes sp. NBC_00393]|uniref:hypothetical protein n=1 Tax=Actinoplanes sp. NBC_00393 TaxID=2975953 RepID=UPI002E1C6196
MASTYGGRHVAVDNWVPVERRWLGLDKRTLLPGLVVFAIAILLRSIIPSIDQATPVDDVIEAGDRLNLDNGLTIAPPVGWELVDGILVGADTVQPGAGSASASMVQGGVQAQIAVSSFAGDAGALLDQVNRNDSRSDSRPGFTVSAEPTAITTVGGITGAVEGYTSAAGDGLLAAFTFPDGRGMAVEVAGTSEQLAARTSQIDAMLRSVTLEVPQ